MYQTFQVSRGMNDENDLAFRLCIEERMPSSRRLQVALDEIVGLSRSDALKCFKTSCRAPLSLSEIGGEWDGILLDNNGIIMPSSLVPNVTSVGLRYSDYQNFLSPWYSMRDEVRLLELPSPVEFEIMIGFGCMKWSGGFLNGAPFCLYREKEIVPQLPK
ncbi:predicted protein [Phaeodactylum tricornutum CCAP 1055/1]|uniref:Uncharacterized protein n=3 Tax=Phaeodactylum tricornutum TaxID=2850 RepID=B7FUP9_PHATC|nr:predicted protein [Phaeodactylum tricornutum CCAP 1055/1]EEC50300.1 predicted protein [Phaeodactylum tricornutum CCAP 1055/1]|eukprot:XP_002178635.1 predicted protein [Phaeodactylum tricornutum CCAP 1055/1]